ncbi:MAG: hypothetical protein IMX04_06165 [Candidatus Carbobacillus altaicus]|nr:hypothetical protein [Candidatus Carbobacillus altaicus]
MKKLWGYKLTLFLTIIAILAAGCSPNNPNNVETNAPSEPTHNPFESNEEENRDIKVSTQSEISLNANKIVVTIKNIGLDNVSFGLEYEIQILNNGRWEFFYKDETVDSIGIYLEKGESYDQIINLNENINWEIDGTYRIIKKINENPYISNEFNLIP